MIKWFINKWYKHNPVCMCGYKMKPIKHLTYPTWVCIWSIHKCGWETFQTENGKLHWLKKKSAN